MSSPAVPNQWGVRRLASIQQVDHRLCCCVLIIIKSRCRYPLRKCKLAVCNIASYFCCGHNIFVANVDAYSETNYSLQPYTVLQRLGAALSVESHMHYNAGMPLLLAGYTFTNEF